MMSASAAIVLMPDAEPAWKLWRSLTSPRAERLDSPAEVKDGSKPVVVGLPATACRSVGLILPATDESLIPAMIEAQLERRGFPVKTEPTKNFAWHVVGRDAVHLLVSVDVLAEPFPDNLEASHAVNYVAALRLMSLPARDIVVLEEQGLIVLAAGVQGRLWHSHVIGGPETTVEELARELDLTKMSLESAEGFTPLRGVTLVGDRLIPWKEDLKKLTALPVETAATLEPNRALKLDTFPKLLPAAVFDAQASKARAGRIIRLSILGAMAYAGIIFLCWSYLQKLDQSAAVLREQVAASEGPAADVRATQARWHALEPATEKFRYPMVQLSQITALLPPSGVVIRRFEAKHQLVEKAWTNEVEIIGDARDAQTVALLEGELEGHTNLGKYSWNKPVPSLKDRVASFKLTGKLGGK